MMPYWSAQRMCCDPCEVEWAPAGGKRCWVCVLPGRQGHVEPQLRSPASWSYDLLEEAA